MVSRPTDAAIAQAYFEEIDYNEAAFGWFAWLNRPQLARIAWRARQIEAERAQADAPEVGEG